MDSKFLIKVLVLTTSCLSVGYSQCPSTTRPTFSSQAELLAYLQITTTCNTYFVEVTMDACALLNLGFTPNTDVGVGNGTIAVFLSSNIADVSCMGVVSGTTVTFSFNLTACDPAITVTSSSVSYTHTIRSFDQQVTTAIDRNTPLFVDITCDYTLTMQKSINFAHTALVSNSPVQLPTQNEMYSVLTSLFTDNIYLKPLPTKRDKSVVVKMPDTIFLGLTIDSEETYLAMEAIACWATPTPKASGVIRYDLLESGCPTTQSAAKNFVIVDENFKSDSVKIAIQSFAWSDSIAVNNQLFLHCQVSICDWVLDYSCVKKSCKPKSIASRKNEKPPREAEIVSIGPVIINSKKSKCAQNNGGCSHICTEVDQTKKCLCPRNWYLEKDQLNCKHFSLKTRAAESEFYHQGRMSIERNMQSDESTIGGFLWTLFLVIMVIGAAFVVAVFVQSFLRKTKGRRD